MSVNDDQIIGGYLRALASAAAGLPADRRDELIEQISAHIAEARAAAQSSTADAPVPVDSILDRLGTPEEIVRVAAEQAAAEHDPFAPGAAPAAYAGAPGAPAYSSDSPGAAAGSTSPGFGPAAAYQQAGYPQVGYPQTGYPQTGYPEAVPTAPGMTALEIWALILLVAGAFLGGIGWVVGLVLLWISPRWQIRDKLLGSLIWPGGLAGVLVIGGAVAAFAATGAPGGSCLGNATSAHATCTSASTGNGSLVLVLAILLAVIIGQILVTVRLVRQARRWPGARA